MPVGIHSLTDAPDAPLTPQGAAALLQLRRAARTCYADFVRYWIVATRAPIVWGWHIEYLADIMQGVAERDPRLRFLCINIPPRFLKSTLLSQLWQAWMLGVDPTARSSLFSISSSATLAARDSRRTLDTVRSEWYRHVFPAPALDIGSKETETEWEVKGGGYRLACGREGTVTGRGAHHLLVDDLVSAQEGDSETIREQANEFLGKTLRSRLDDQRTGTITNIQQRLHERDATGCLQELRKLPGGDIYEVISLPNEAPSRTIVTLNGKHYATREAGDLLHPDYLGRTETLALKATMRANYDGQYQQTPTKMSGGMLDPRRLVRLRGTALEIKSMLGVSPNIYLDLASTEKETQKDDPDFNAVIVAGKDQLQRLIIFDVWKRQTADHGTVARVVANLQRVYNTRAVRIEKGGLLNLFRVAAETYRKLTHSAPLRIAPIPGRSVDKIERSLPYEGLLNAGLVCVPEGAEWLADFEAGHRAFPRGAHDDVEDCCFDAAADYPLMSTGEAPPRDPDNEAEIADKEMKDRIERAVAEAIGRPRGGENWTWD